MSSAEDEDYQDLQHHLQSLPKYIKKFISPQTLLVSLSDTKKIIQEHQPIVKTKSKKKRSPTTDTQLQITEEDEKLFSAYPYLISFHPAILSHERTVLNRWNEQIVRRQQAPPVTNPFSPLPLDLPPVPTHSLPPPSFTFVRTQGTQNDGLRTMMIQDSDKTQIESADKSHSSSTMDLKDSTTPDTDATDSIPLFYSFIAPPSTVNTHTG